MEFWLSPEQGPHNLPEPHTSLIGRQREMADVAALLARDRLVTLVGPAGIGKTRLGLHCAAGALDRHPDGAWFVDLSLVAQPHLVLHAVAAAVGARERAGETLQQSVNTSLAGKSLLLVLDNCEHLVHACAEVVCRLLRASTGVRILATSRSELGVVGEVAWPVPPLASPPARWAPETSQSDATRLFLARTTDALVVDESTAACVARICRRLDGIPLAIELAAGRAHELTPQEIEANLENRFQLLRTDRLEFSKRQRSFHAALEWSHDLLSDAERVLLRRLAVFAGPFTATDAAQVCSFDRVGGDGVGSVLARLAKMSLLAPRTDDGRIAYRMLESIRAFAVEKLLEAGEDEVIRRGHAEWCSAMAQRADSDAPGRTQAGNLTVLAGVRAELRSALAWTIEHEPELALCLAGDLTRFWVAEGGLEEARTWLERALAAEPAASAARAKALWGNGLVACLLGDFAAVGAALHEGIELARRLDDGVVLARLLSLMGVTRIFIDPPGALVVLSEAISLARRHHGELTTLVGSLAMEGFARALCGELAGAARSLEESLASGSELGDSQALVMALVGLGHVLAQQDAVSGARKCLDDGLAMARRVHNPIWMALALGYRADLEANLGHVAHARRLAGEAVGVARLTGAGPVVGLCLAMAGNVELGAGDPAASVVLFDEALLLCAGGERGGVRTRALVGRGRAFLDLGEADAAQAVLEEALSLAEDVQNRIAAGAALHQLGRCAAGRGDHDGALQLLRRSLVAQSGAGHQMAVPGLVDAIACQTAHVGDVVRALRLISAADSMRERTGRARSPQDRDYDTVVALAEETLPKDVRAAAVDAGEQLTAEQVVPYACAGLVHHRRAPGG